MSIVEIEQHHKSRQRIREQGEVFTQRREVDAILDLMPDAFEEIDTRFLEPSAGNGNFLVAILERKIALISEAKHGHSRNWYQYSLIRCLASIYSVDIDEENVLEARKRLTHLLLQAVNRSGQKLHSKFRKSIAAILSSNIVWGNALEDAEGIRFIRYEACGEEKFELFEEYLVSPPMDLFSTGPLNLGKKHFSSLGEVRKL